MNRRLLLTGASASVLASCTNFSSWFTPSAPPVPEPSRPPARTWKPKGEAGSTLDMVDLPAPPSEFGSRDGEELTGDLPDYVNSGRETPEHAAFAIAQVIMQSAPYKCRPIDVAEYFERITKGDPEVLDLIREQLPEEPDLPEEQRLRTKVGPHFGRGWDRVYNPVIIDLFNATWTNPLAADLAGDATHWCAAFANWCIMRSRAEQPEHVLNQRFPVDLRTFATMSASSGSFRCWGRKLEQGEEPAYGDVVVWRRWDSEEIDCVTTREGRGHVGFVLRVEKGATSEQDVIVTLGGNQWDPERRKTGAVFTQRLRHTSASRVLHSFRTAPWLRS